MTDEHQYVRLARKAIEEYVSNGKKIKPGHELSPELKKKAGAFVSLKKDGNLRGCIGTVNPTRENLAEEIINNAISAATRDPRFSSVRREELGNIDISVDVLEEPEEIDSRDQLDPERYGVIVKKGRRSGLLLPDLDGVNTVEEQLNIARKKAGIGPGEDVQLFRFRVKKYGR